MTGPAAPGTGGAPGPILAGWRARQSQRVQSLMRAVAGSGKMSAWEYVQEVIGTDMLINGNLERNRPDQLGVQGWEAYAVVAEGVAGAQAYFRFFFKRLRA